MAPATAMMIERNEIGCAGGACSTMDPSEKIYIAAGSGLCGAIVLSVGAVILYKRLRTRSRAKADLARGDTSQTQPMISAFNQSRFSFHAPLSSPQQAYQPSTRPPISPHIGSPSSSYHDHSSSNSSGSSSGHSHNSPMSDHSAQFHFPILSADGHLMPPVPASSRQQSWNISEGDLGSGRPLPLAPGSQGHDTYEFEYGQGGDYSPNPFEGGDEKMIPQYYIEDTHTQTQTRPLSQGQEVELLAPAPRTPTKWSYEPSRASPSPERSEEGVQQIVGLYPSLGFNGDGSIGYDYGYATGKGLDNASIRSSPRVAQVQDMFGFHQPQSATYHRSFSAEGEEILADRSS